MKLRRGSRQDGGEKKQKGLRAEMNMRPGRFHFNLNHQALLLTVLVSEPHPVSVLGSTFFIPAQPVSDWSIPSMKVAGDGVRKLQAPG